MDAMEDGETAWRQRVDRVLKGATFETLVSTTEDGIAIQPLYAKGEAAGFALRQHPDRPWRIAQRVDHPEPAAANELALGDLVGGADALTLVFAGASSARGFGIAPADLRTALSGVELDLVALRLDLPPGGEAPAVDALVALASAQRQVPAALDVDFGLDPIGAMAATGRGVTNWQARCGDQAGRLLDAGFVGPLLRADGRVHHDAGATEAQELAAVLATALAYLRLLEARGLPLAEARSALSVQLVADCDQFLTIAKFRALRRLWARVEDACGLAPAPLRLAAETSFRIMTRHDPAVNWLRTTSALFSAGTGGADQICVLPHTLAIGLPDAFSRRMARNEQTILIEESHLAHVLDPGAGSGAVEALTSGFCEAAWALFQRLEAGGGLVAALEAGSWQNEIGEARAARQRRIADGSAPLIGTTIFRNTDERPPAVLMQPRPGLAQETDFAPLVAARDAEPHEGEGMAA